MKTKLFTMFFAFFATAVWAQYQEGYIPNTASHRIYYNTYDDGTAWAAGVAQGYWKKIGSGEEERDTFIYYKPINATSLSVKSTVNDPETGKSYKVTGIYGFGTEYELRSISMPSTIETIGDNAFNGCYMLASINLHEGIKKIGNRAFSNTILHSVTLPSTLKEIGSGYQSAFYDNRSLVSMTVNADSLEGPYVGPGVRELTFGPNVKCVGGGAAKGCQELQTITFEGNEIELSLGYNGGAFEGCTALTSIDLSKVAIIGSGTFKGCFGIKNLTIPENVTSVGSSAFADMKLDSLIIESNAVLKNENGAYQSEFRYIFSDDYGQNMTPIDYLVIGDNITEIGHNTFNGCDNFTQVKLGSNVATIDDNAFRNTAITELELPERLDSIGESAFYDCDRLESLSLPRNLRAIGKYAFARTGIKELKYDDVPFKCDSTALFDADRSIIYPSGDYLLPGYKLETIGDGAFKNCQLTMNRTEFMVFPSSVKSIGYEAFYNNKITNVVFPENLEAYPGGGFTKEETNARHYVDGGGGGGDDDPEDPSSPTGYRSAVFLSTKLWDDRDYYAPKYVFWDDVPTIRFAGEHVDSIPWKAFRGNSHILACTIEPDVYKSIMVRNGKFTFPVGDLAFYECENLKNFTIYGERSTLEPEKFLEVSPSYIGREAFSKCNGLTYVILGEELDSIGRNAFKYSNNIKRVDWNSKKLLEIMKRPNENGNVNTGFWDWFSTFEELWIGEGITEIPAWCLSGCKNLKKILPAQYITKIGQYSFQMCSSLTNLNFLHPVLFDSIPDGAFTECEGLTEFKIPKYVKHIGKYAFQLCKFTDVRIPYYVEVIDDGAFSLCQNLKTFTIPNNSLKQAEKARGTWRDAYEEMDDAWKEEHQNDAYRYLSTSTPVFMGYNIFSWCEELHDVKIYRPLLAQIPGEEEQLYLTSPRQFQNSALRRIHLPYQLDGINFGSFIGCENLKFIDLRGDLPYGIDDGAFMDCKSMISVRIPPFSKRNYLGEFSFSGCTALNDVVVQWTNGIPGLPRNAFDAESAEDGKTTLWVPKGTTDAYRASEWGIFKNMKEYCGYKIKGDGSLSTFLVTTNLDGSEQLVIDYGERLEIPAGEYPLEGKLTYTAKANEEGWLGVFVPSELNVAILEEMGFKTYTIDKNQDKTGTLKVTEVSNDARIKAHEAVMLRVKDQSLYNQVVSFVGENYAGLLPTITNMPMNLMDIVCPSRSLSNSEAKDKNTVKKMKTKKDDNMSAPLRAPEADDEEDDIETEGDIAISPYEFFVKLNLKEGEEQPEYIEIEIAGENPSGINELVRDRRDSNSEAIYNMSGQRVNISYKGVIIKNGRKVVIK